MLYFYELYWLYILKEDLELVDFQNKARIV